MTRVRLLDRPRANPTTLPLLLLTCVLFGTLVGVGIGYGASLIIN